jgi:hypothetical protein
MNERIRLLAEQATTIVDTVNSQGYSSSCAHFDKEKFAELIVRECEKVAKDGPWYYDTPSLRSGWQNPINHVCNVMKEHFGVEQ